MPKTDFREFLGHLDLRRDGGDEDRVDLVAGWEAHRQVRDGHES